MVYGPSHDGPSPQPEEEQSERSSYTIEVSFNENASN